MKKSFKLLILLNDINHVFNSYSNSSSAIIPPSKSNDTE